MGAVRLGSIIAEQTKYARAERGARNTREEAALQGARNEADADTMNNGIDDWCDLFMVRLYLSEILTRPNKNKPVSSRTAGTDAAILSALCFLMRRGQCGYFEASESKVAEHAQVAENTAAAGLRRLEDAAYIIRHPAGVGAPTRYSLVAERLDPIPKDAARWSVAELTDLISLITGDLSHDAFHARNLGKTALRIYLHLAAYPDRKMAEIARETGRAKPTVKAAVERLRALGMADEEDGRWRTYTRRIRRDTDLDEVVDAAAKINVAKRRIHDEKRREKAEAEASFAALYHFYAGRAEAEEGVTSRAA